LGELVNLSLHDERYSHILVVPVISAFLVWLNRERIFAESPSNLTLGIPIVLIGISIGLARFGGLQTSPTPSITLSINILGAILVLAGAFVAFYGQRALVAALFPLALLLLMVPIPVSMMDRAVVALQKGSADISYGLFKVVGMPVLRDGFRFSLPGVDIEVAEECSGVRSSLSLLISSILAAHVMLRSRWTQLGFALLTIPVVIFKNAVRIVTIAWLGVYVDRGFFFGNLHRYGGLPFSLLSIAILYAVMRVLQKSGLGSEGLGRAHRTAG
jgi:exosortase